MHLDPKYGPAVRVVREHFDGPIRPYMSLDYGRGRKDEVISFLDPPGKHSLGDHYEFVERLQRELPEQFIAFIGNRYWAVDDHNLGTEFVVALANSQIEAVKLAESQGINQGVRTERVIEVLTRYDNQYGIRILVAAPDLVEFKLKELPSDISAFLDEMGRDLVVPTEPRNEVIADIRKTKLVGLWWD